MSCNYRELSVDPHFSDPKNLHIYFSHPPTTSPSSPSLSWFSKILVEIMKSSIYPKDIL